MLVLKIQLTEIDVHWWFDRPLLDPPTNPPIDPLLLIQKPLTVECHYGRLASFIADFINKCRIDTLTLYKPSAFKQNTGYITCGWRGRRHRRTCGGSLQTISRGGSS